MKRAREAYKLAIVGSRTFTDKNLFNSTLEKYIIDHGLPTTIVSGGAAGADTLAERWAVAHGIATEIYKPDWKKHGKAAGVLRNTDIVANCTHMIAFPSKRGKGTQDSIKKAIARGIDVKVVKID